MSMPSGEISDWSEEEADDEDGFSMTEKKPQWTKILSQKSPSQSSEKSRRKTIFTPRDNKQETHFKVMTACMTGNISVIDEFLDNGNDINDYLGSGWTLLLYASSAVLPIVVDHLLKRGADPNVHKNGYTPLMAICESTVGSPEQQLTCITLLLEAKADPNSSQKDGIISLMYAAKNGVVEVVKKMIECTQDINFVDSDGRSAIFYAVAANLPEIVKILMAEGASTNIRDRRDLTIAEIAMTKDYKQILEMLKFGEEENIQSYCPMSQMTNWKDAFPGVKEIDNEVVDADIASVLYALGLDRYRSIFKGMELKEFLKLTDEELIKLGMELPFHRKRLQMGLLKFHTKHWSSQSLGTMNKAIACRIHDGITILGNIVRQMGVIGASFRFVKNSLPKLGNNENSLSDIDKENFKAELYHTERSLGFLKKDLQQMLTFAQKVKRNNVVHPPAGYIGPEKDNKHMAWPIFIGATVITGFYLTKTAYLNRLWN